MAFHVSLPTVSLSNRWKKRYSTARSRRSSSGNSTESRVDFKTASIGSPIGASAACALFRSPAADRIVSIEDTLELRIDRKNCVRFEARGIDGESVTIRGLVRHALRHRPDHIVVGEVRGGEAADLLQALNTGHGGSLTTIHANNAESALSRLATCAMQGETDLPWEVTCRGVVDGISMVIHMTRREGNRYVEEALHVGDYDAAKRALALQARCVRRPPTQTRAGAVMPDNPARTMRQGRAGIVRAMLLLVRGYNAEKHLCLTEHVWSVPDDSRTEDGLP